MSPQASPVFSSTLRGTFSGIALGISSVTISFSCSSSRTGVSKMSSSCTCRIIIERIFNSSKRSWMRTMAILIMSAAVPWMGMLIAIRSPAALCIRFLDLISRMYRRRFFSVFTYPFSATSFFTDSTYSRMPG